MKGAWVKGTGTQGLNGCSHQTFNSKGNAKDRCTTKTKSDCVCYLSVFFYHGTSHDEKGLPRTDGMHKAGTGNINFKSRPSNFVMKPLNKAWMCS